jgi:aryl-alcohol dehydrogenase-like predicted oxidoreductase
VQAIAQHHGVTPQQVALAWHLHQSPNSLPIPGTTTPGHLAENLAAAQLHLSDDEVRRLTGLASEDQPTN